MDADAAQVMPLPQHCPRCDNMTIIYPALSRIDNTTHICAACGLDEAIESLRFGAMTPKWQWPIRLLTVSPDPVPVDTPTSYADPWNNQEQT